MPNDTCATEGGEMARVPLLERLGLHRPELRAWAMYDWANSAFWATIILIFPIYFIKVAAQGVSVAVATTRFATATTIAMTIIALLSPILGAIADYAGLKKVMLGTFVGIGVAATAGMFFIHRGEWRLAAALFIVGNIGVSGAQAFYDSLLPHVAREDEVDRVSSAGFALGYLGSGILMAANLLVIQKPGLFGLADAEAAMRVSFLSVAVWWLVFSIPLFRTIPEPPRQLEADESERQNPVAVGFTRLLETLRELRRYRQAFLTGSTRSSGWAPRTARSSGSRTARSSDRCSPCSSSASRARSCSGCSRVGSGQSAASSSGSRSTWSPPSPPTPSPPAGSTWRSACWSEP
jgi:UMF1 family MFS transporter